METMSNLQLAPFAALRLAAFRMKVFAKSKRFSPNLLLTKRPLRRTKFGAKKNLTEEIIAFDNI